MTTMHALEPQLLEAIVARDNLQRAWRRVKANKGASTLADHQSQRDER
ncbi:MAG: hypothetical protein ACYDC8_02480 [Gammaproteobacteria bacterium]